MKRLLLGFVLLSFAVPHANAQDAEMQLWQTIQRSNTPADYQLYLQMFPNGRFASLARIRAQGAAPTAAADANQGQADSDAPSFTVTPTVAHVGQQFIVGCSSLPTGPNSGGDAIVAVQAGSPPANPNMLTQGVQKEYVANCKSRNGDGTVKIGPLPPGQWEFRWMTSLYNLDGLLQTKATVNATVR